MGLTQLIALRYNFAYENETLFRSQFTSALRSEIGQAEIVGRVFRFVFCPVLSHGLCVNYERPARFKSTHRAQQEIGASGVGPAGFSARLGETAAVVEKLGTGYGEGIYTRDMDIPLV
jgi:hypothetical protein